MNQFLRKIQEEIDTYKAQNPNESVGELSDTYHSFNDLYKHRTYLTALAFMNIPYAWKSKVHEDGSMFDGMFIVGAPTEEGMISYHYDLEYWDIFKVPSLPHAPHFDGHTPEDVLDRIDTYIRFTPGDDNEEIEKIVKDEILPTFGDNLLLKASFIGFYN